MTMLDTVLAGVADAIASGETTLADVLARLEGGTAPARPAARYPTVREHVEATERVLDQNTRRTWSTHYRRLLEGTAYQCGCTCDACLDVEAGCSCGCAGCRNRVRVEPLADLELVPRSIRKTHVEEWATTAQRMSAKKAVAANRRRAAAGLAPKPSDGNGGRENAVTAYRHLFGRLVDDELWETNPAMAVRKPKRNDTVRRGLYDDEIGPYFDAVVSGGDDPELDFHLAWLHLESGARRGGAVALRMGDLKRATQMIRLHEKADKDDDQPVSGELIDALTAFAVSRGGSRCDPASPDYDPDAPVLYYRDSTPGAPHRLSERRYDTLYRRLQLTLPWAAEIMLTSHCLRKTGASIVERIAGSEVARLYLRHGRRTVTQTYTEASLRRLAEAVEVYTGRPHPSARP